MLSVTSWCLIGVFKEQWPRYLKMIRNSGFGGIELHIEANAFPISLESKKEELAWLMDAIDTADLEVTGFSTMLHMNHPVTSKDVRSKELALESVDKMFDLAKWTRARHVSIAPGGRMDHWQDALPVVRELNERAKSMGISLMLENVWYSFSCNMNELEQLVVSLNDSNIGICFDIGNMLPYGNIEKWLLRLDKKVKKIHISDSMVGETPQICPIGQGQVDWKSVGKVVKEIHYDGDITLELFPREGVSLPMELMRVSKYLKKHFN